MFVITRTHHGWQYNKLDGHKNPSPYSDAEIAKWIVGTMGFLIERNETLDGPQFSERIGRYYSAENPRTAFAMAFLTAA